MYTETESAANNHHHLSSLGLVAGAISTLKYVICMGFLITCSAMADDSLKQDTEWREYKHEHGIKGFERNLADSKYLETRAETVIDAPIEIILEVLDDISSYPEWMHRCKQAIQLEQIGEYSKVLYFVQTAPLGSPDRDVIISAISSVDREKGVFNIALNSSDKYPHPVSQEIDTSGRQRMTAFKGEWDLRVIDANNTKVIYTTFTDPGGYAPGFIVNNMMRKVSFLSLKGMTNMVKESRYHESAERRRTSLTNGAQH